MSPQNHIFEDPDITIWKQGISREGIKDNDSLIGLDVVLLDGVATGRESVIGVRALATNDIPPYSLAVGGTARAVKKKGKV